MSILTYKRTHVGDPNEAGEFGIYDCMGRVRDYAFDAVIGVGGIGAEPKSYGIDRKITWVGVSPRRVGNAASIVMFKHFVLKDSNGPFLDQMAPTLSKRLYEGKARILLTPATQRKS